MHRPLRHLRQLCCVTFLIACAPVASFSAEPLELARGTLPHQPQQPHVAVAADGSIHAVYGIGAAVHYRRSDDGGQTFTKAVALPLTGKLALGMRRGPRLAVTTDCVCVTVIAGPQGNGRDGDLLAFRSMDGGVTWKGPVRVNDAAASAREGLHGMAAGPDGQLSCVWLDLRNNQTEVMISSSKDNGETWSSDVLVYQSGDGSVCECCHPSVAISDRGEIQVQWRNSLDGARDMYVISSSDGGKTFGKALRLDSRSWPLDACPMDGGAIAMLGSHYISAWRRNNAVFLSRSDQTTEQRVGAGEQPWVAATDAGPYIVWLQRRDGAALLLSPGSTSPTTLAAQAFDPVIAAGPHGQGPVVAAWESRQGTRYTVWCQVVASR